MLKLKLVKVSSVELNSKFCGIHGTVPFRPYANQNLLSFSAAETRKCPTLLGGSPVAELSTPISHRLLSA
jgi:hypothetical protein